MPTTSSSLGSRARKLARFLKHPHVSIAFRITRWRNRAAILRAHRLLYRSGVPSKTRWFGARLIKNPLDLWVYQELIYDIRPELIVETGTLDGGSAAYFADICELAGRGEVISIDINPVSPDYPARPRITYLGGRSSADADVVAEVRERARGKKTMVVLDSDHSTEHVAAEIEAYAPLVSPGSYLIVEDTNIGLIFKEEWRHGPAEAVAAFLEHSDEFEADLNCERYLITFHPGGFLRRREQAQ